jgi:hypothetical protein
MRNIFKAKARHYFLGVNFGAVWSKIGSKDFRDVIKIARLVKNKQTRKEVNTILKTIIKYS